jgi:hypothetical protein
MKIKVLSLLAGAALSVSGATSVMAQQSTDEVKAVVSEMLADAETRSSLLSGGDAGHDGRFFIAGDGFRLNIGGLIQFRYMFNIRNGSNLNDPNDDFTHGFYNARTKVDFSGELNKDWFFRVRLEDDNTTDGSSAGVDYAYAGYKFANGMKCTFGQFKTALLREELVSDAKQLAVERSFVNFVFNQGYSQGVELSNEMEGWRWFLDFSDGMRSANTAWNSEGATSLTPNSSFLVAGQGEYAFTGRAEFMFSGAWKQFEDFTSPKGSDGAAMFGIAGTFQQSTDNNQPNNLEQTVFEYTADLSLKGDSWNLYGAFIGRHMTNRVQGNDADTDDFGIVIQGGYRFTENTELFARWDALMPDSSWAQPGTSLESMYNFITVGVNQYYAGHAAKATLDVYWCPIATADLVNVTGQDVQAGILGSEDDNEVAIRLQFQVVF